MDHKLQKVLLKDAHNEIYDETKEGIFFPRHGFMLSGEYMDRVNGGEPTFTKNLIPKEALMHVLNVAIGTKAKPAGSYLALFSGAAAPADNWTAANFSATANEITSLTEGYTNATRPEFIPSDTSDQKYIDNFSNVARVTIATTSQLNVTGVALLTNNQRGGTTGILLSATKYPATRVFQNGDVFDIGYRITATS
jgi:hypothetical protein